MTTAEWARDVERVLAAAKKTHKRKRKRRRNYEYIPALVSYFDVLGMKELLRRAGDDANKVASVLNIFREFSTPDEQSRSIWKWKFVNFSDLIVRVLPINTEANIRHRLGLVFHETFDLCHLQVNLINRGVLVRGALTLGFITVDGGLIFGPALSRAYKIESKIAKYPRIAIDKDVLRGLKEIPALRSHPFEEEMQYLEGTLRKDKDGVLFLDYLNWTMNNADSNLQHIDFVRTHRKFILTQIAELAKLDMRKTESKSRREKVFWMKKLHNTHVRKLDPNYLFDEAGIRRSALLVP